MLAQAVLFVKYCKLNHDANKIEGRSDIAMASHLTATSATATLVGAQTSTRRPQPARTDSSRTMVDVLPVPGGPCAA